MLKYAPLLLCILSPLCLAAEQPRHSAGIDDANRQVLQQLDSSHELLDIQANDDRFSLLYRPAMTPRPHGALLIIPDPGTGKGWLEQVRALTSYLPEHGWSVLALEPPAPPLPQLPERSLPVMTAIKTSPGNDSPATAAETPPPAVPAPTAPPTEVTADSADITTPQIPPYPEQLQQRLDLAWQELEQRNKGKQQVLIGIGKGAIWSTILAIKEGKDTALVLINPAPDTLAQTSLETLLTELEFHQVLDLYYAPLPGYPDAEPSAGLRRLEAARLGLSRYHQSRLPGVFRGWHSDMPRLARHVRGMLERTLLSHTPRDEPETSPADGALPQTPPGRAALRQAPQAQR